MINIIQRIYNNNINVGITDSYDNIISLSINDSENILQSNSYFWSLNDNIDNIVNRFNEIIQFDDFA